MDNIFSEIKEEFHCVWLTFSRRDGDWDYFLGEEVLLLS